MKEKKKGKTLKKIVVNGLSLSRIVGSLFLPILFASGNVAGIIALLVGVFATDFLDGKLARAWRVQTTGGKHLDPLGDKVLAFSTILSLIGSQNLLFLPLFLETAIVAVSVYRGVNSQEQEASMIGKIKTWFLSVAIVLSAINILNPEALNWVSDKLIISENVVQTSISMAAVFEIQTLIGYMQDAKKQNDDTKKELKAEKKTIKERISELKDMRTMLKDLFDEDRFEQDKDKSLMEIITKDEIIEKRLVNKPNNR